MGYASTRVSYVNPFFRNTQLINYCRQRDELERCHTSRVAVVSDFSIHGRRPVKEGQWFSKRVSVRSVVADTRPLLMCCATRESLDEVCCCQRRRALLAVAATQPNLSYMKTMSVTRKLQATLYRWCIPPWQQWQQVAVGWASRQCLGWKWRTQIFFNQEDLKLSLQPITAITDDSFLRLIPQETSYVWYVTGMGGAHPAAIYTAHTTPLT